MALEMLQRLGVMVTTAADGEAAVDMAIKTPFSAILMDVQMPGTDGLTATKLLRQRGCKTPIIALTSNALSSDRQACLAAGMNEFVAKPINRAKLEEALRPWLAAGVATCPPAELKSPIDFLVRDTLEEDLGQQLLDDLTTKFWSDTREMIERTKELIVEGKAREALRELHTLKGVSGTLGMSSISETAQSLEQALRHGHLTDLSSLDRDLAASRRALESHVPANPPMLLSA